MHNCYKEQRFTHLFRIKKLYHVYRIHDNCKIEFSESQRKSLQLLH